MSTPCLLGFCVWISRTRTGDLLQGICGPPSAPRVARMHVDYRRLSWFRALVAWVPETDGVLHPAEAGLMTKGAS
jgi:hypothetical protein